jgi:hypothetical protein
MRPTFTPEQLDHLAAGETVEAGGVAWTVNTSGDADTQLADFDCYGRVEWIGRRPEMQRPAGFSGRAEKIHTGRDAYWWEPPADIAPAVWHSDAQLRRSLRHSVLDILAHGFQIVSLSGRRRCECCGSVREVTGAALGGVDPFPDASYLRDIIQDLGSMVDVPETVAAAH